MVMTRDTFQSRHECQTVSESSCELESCRRSFSLSKMPNSQIEGGMELAGFHIYFSQFQETRFIQVQTMSFDSVVSSIGGAMGVCLGASLVTCLELVAFLSQLLTRTVLRRCRNRTSDDPPVEMQDVGNLPI